MAYLFFMFNSLNERIMHSAMQRKQTQIFQLFILLVNILYIATIY